MTKRPSRDDRYAGMILQTSRTRGDRIDREVFDLWVDTYGPRAMGKSRRAVTVQQAAALAGMLHLWGWR